MVFFSLHLIPTVVPQALCTMVEYHEEWPLLIITPSSLRLTWSDAISTWLPGTTVNVLMKGSDSLSVVLTSLVYIVQAGPPALRADIKNDTVSSRNAMAPAPT